MSCDRFREEVALFVVMALAGSRVRQQGAHALRPIPGRSSVKVRPKELERALEIDFDRPMAVARTPRSRP